MGIVLPSTATARAGETLDALCWRTLGTTDAIEDVLALNPRLTSVVLAEGDEVALPARSPAPRTLETVQLWS
jgi:phage tail protein X